MGVNYYTVFKKKQMQQQLEDLENWLKQMDELSAQAVQSQIEAKKKKWFLNRSEINHPNGYDSIGMDSMQRGGILD